MSSFTLKSSVVDQVYPRSLRNFIKEQNPYGRTVYVDSTHGNSTDTAAGAGETMEKPYATLDAALDAAISNDLILLAPSHAETCISAGDLDADVANVTILGMGRASEKATITFSTSTAADLDIDAAGVTIQNVKFVAAIADLAAPIDVNANDFSLIDCEFSNGSLSATEAPDDWIEVATAVSRLRVEGNYMNDTTTGSASFLAAGAAITDFYFSDNRIKGDFSTAVVRGAAAWVNFYNDTSSNVLTNANAAGVDFTRTGSWTEFHKLDGDWWEYLENDVADLTAVGAVEVNSHELFTVTGQIQFKLDAIITTAVTTGSTTTISWGMGAATTGLTGAIDSAVTVIGYQFGLGTLEGSSNGADIGYTVGTAVPTAGALVARLWYRGEGKVTAPAVVAGAL